MDRFDLALGGFEFLAELPCVVGPEEGVLAEENKDPALRIELEWSLVGGSFGHWEHGSGAGVGRAR